LRPNGRYILNVPAIGLEHIYISQMNITREQLDELTSVIEDTVEYACDQQMLSGELAWTVIECLATAKIAELKGELAAA
jgi:hypothetical protein